MINQQFVQFALDFLGGKLKSIICNCIQLGKAEGRLHQQSPISIESREQLLPLLTWRQLKSIPKHSDCMVELHSSHFSTEASADGEGAALGRAVGGQLKHLGVHWAHLVVLEVHEVVRDLVEAPGRLLGVVFVIVVVLLGALDLPLEVGAGGVELLSAVELGAALDEPVGRDDAAAVGAVAAEAAVVLLGEVEEALAWVGGGVPSSVQWLQGVSVVLQTLPQQRSNLPFSLVMSSRLFRASKQMVPLVLPEARNLAVSSKSIWYWLGKVGGVCARHRLHSAIASRILISLILNLIINFTIPFIHELLPCFQNALSLFADCCCQLHVKSKARLYDSSPICQHNFLNVLVGWLEAVQGYRKTFGA